MDGFSFALLLSGSWLQQKSSLQQEETEAMLEAIYRKVA